MKHFFHEWKYPYLETQEEYRAVTVLKKAMEILETRWEVSTPYVSHAPEKDEILVGFRWKTPQDGLWNMERGLARDVLWGLKDSDLSNYVEIVVESFESIMSERDSVRFG